MVHIRRAFSIVEVLTAMGILMFLAGISYPVFASARERAKIQSSLSRLKQLHVATMLYQTDHGPEDSLCFPPYSYVYSSYLGLGADFFRSPCGYRGIIPNKLSQGYQYTWEQEPSIVDYFQYMGGRAVLFTDASCNPSKEVWESPAAMKRGLGVRVDGSAINLHKRGLPIVLSWWER